LWITSPPETRRWPPTSNCGNNHDPGVDVKIIIAGASGMVGLALTRSLAENGNTVFRLVRRRASATEEIEWDPASETLRRVEVSGADAVINLAGENIAEGRWTPARRERIRTSRFASTWTLVNAIRSASPKPGILMTASAVGYYGNRGDETLTESNSAGAGFLPEVCQEWERLARPSDLPDLRSVQLRFGVILDPAGGMLRRLRPVFRAGLGGRLGTGEQWMSWISLEDVLGAMQWVLARRELGGPINVTAPAPLTNAEFTAAYASALHRRAPLAVPAPALRLVFGQMADEMLLSSTRAIPEKLSRSGFVFQHSDLDAYLRAAAHKL
jgi:uncharacterized protein (TIGR01777 family)